jgi:hypothetical protein
MKGDYRAMKHGIMSEETFNSRNAQFLTGDRDKIMSQLERQYQILQKRAETQAQYKANKEMTGNSRTGMTSEDWARQHGKDMSTGELNIRQSNDYKQAVQTREYQDNYYAQKRAAQEQAAAEEARAAADEKRWQAEMSRENVSDVVPSQREAQKVPSAQSAAEGEAAKDVQLSYNNYTSDLNRAKLAAGKDFMGRESRNEYFVERMNKRKAEIDAMKTGEERTAAIENFNQDLQSGPGINDYLMGNKIPHKAAGFGIAAVTADVAMGDGRRSNAQLYSSPF